MEAATQRCSFKEMFLKSKAKYRKMPVKKFMFMFILQIFYEN